MRNLFSVILLVFVVMTFSAKANNNYLENMPLPINHRMTELMNLVETIRSSTQLMHKSVEGQKVNKTLDTVPVTIFSNVYHDSLLYFNETNKFTPSTPFREVSWVQIRFDNKLGYLLIIPPFVKNYSDGGKFAKPNYHSFDKIICDSPKNIRKENLLCGKPSYLYHTATPSVFEAIEQNTPSTTHPESTLIFIHN